MASPASRPRVMGIVNVTPDSFSDGGKYLGAADGIEHARRLIAQGADILDIGGESTRPGAAPVSEFDEILRVVPIIEAIRAASDIPISIDTMKPGVARAAVRAGASLWNDVAALRFSPEAPEVAAELGCEVVLMHMLGQPGTMQDDPRYDDVVAEVEAFLLARAFTAMAAGVAKEKIWLDPGIGFGKTVAHNLALLKALPRFVALGYPILLGASRKRFIAGLDPSAGEATDRLGGSLAAHLAGAASGVAAVRVHDVRETVQALDVQAAIAGA
ncbi:dihydropteroate synthase [Caulobacter sp. FWC2]|uniref:dihydropteroate synthase n=1 Tax=Caulobacter sp. FWC2 TaxID=69664 RepID=UPI000C145905|nr:dihydropteroate synthase [Caulobacter sp. FWC2]PIB94790.1 dihydropteroate synthase [Caulobacter sp. FWC2]